MKQKHMKHIWMALSALLITATFVNCGKKDDGPNATETMNASCYNLQSGTAASTNRSVCNYNYAAFSGFSNFNSSSSSSYTNNNWWGGSTLGASCSSSQVMAYSPTKGVGCVDNGRLSYNGIVAQYRLDTYTNEFTLLPQNTSLGGGYGYGGSNYNYNYNNNNQNWGGATALRICDDAEPCPSGLSCRSPLGNIPSMGVCYF